MSIITFLIGLAFWISLWIFFWLGLLPIALSFFLFDNITKDELYWRNGGSLKSRFLAGYLRDWSIAISIVSGVMTAILYIGTQVI